jgi:hypothetical protein
MKPSLFLAIFIMVLSLAAACVSAEKVPGLQEEPSPCYQLNNCKEPALCLARSAVECSAKGGASWKNRDGVCHKDLAGDDDE